MRGVETSRITNKSVENKVDTQKVSISGWFVVLRQGVQKIVNEFVRLCVDGVDQSPDRPIVLHPK